MALALSFAFSYPGVYISELFSIELSGHCSFLPAILLELPPPILLVSGVVASVVCRFSSYCSAESVACGYVCFILLLALCSFQERSGKIQKEVAAMLLSKLQVRLLL